MPPHRPAAARALHHEVAAAGGSSLPLLRRGLFGYLHSGHTP